VERVDEHGHDLRMAAAIESTKFVDRLRTIFRVAGGLSLVDQLGDFAGITAFQRWAAAFAGTAGAAAVGAVAAQSTPLFVATEELLEQIATAFVLAGRANFIGT